MWWILTQIVLLSILLVELAGSNIHGDLDLSGVSGLRNGIGDQVKSLLSGLNIWSNTSLITDVSGRLTVSLLGERLELLVNLSSLSHGLLESWGGGWDDHELLEGETSTGVGTTVENVLERNWENVRLLGSREVGNVSVEWDTLLGGTSLSNGEGDTEDGVGTELSLVWGSIKLNEELVDGGLVGNGETGSNELWANDGVDVVDGLQDTLSSPLGLVTITELNSLVLTGGSTGWDNGTVEASRVGDEIDFDGWVTYWWKRDPVSIWNRRRRRTRKPRT